MKEYSNYFQWLDDGGWIRVSARAIIFDQDHNRILVERNHIPGVTHTNFIGGGVEVGETLQQCLERELVEETDARIAGMRYLFVLENFYPHKGETRHALEHYFEVRLEDEEITPRTL
jgi:ADP-ribose pyrophosphatase YjhB (NUDIX family)